MTIVIVLQQQKKRNHRVNSIDGLMAEFVNLGRKGEKKFLFKIQKNETKKRLYSLIQ